MPLLSEIFRYAYAALPTKQQQIYASNYSDKKMWLKDLRMFIQQEIDLFVSLQFSEGRRGDPKQKATAKKSLCFYCKQNGHIAENCPILKSTLCVKVNKLLLFMIFQTSNSLFSSASALATPTFAAPTKSFLFASPTFDLLLFLLGSFCILGPPTFY